MSSTGSASPLYLVHGFTQGPGSWSRTLAALGPDYPGRPLTLPGHGPDHPAGPGGFAEALEAVAHQIPEDEPIDLVGYSLGARVVLGLLVTAPERIRRASLIGPSPGLEDEAARRARRDADEAWALLLEQEGLLEFERRWQAQPIFATQNGIDPDWRAEQQALRRSHLPSQLAGAMRQMGLSAMPNYWPALPSIRAPVQLLTGDRDEKFSAIAERMVEAMPNAVSSQILGVGHNVPLEAPEVLAEHLRSFHRSD